MPAGRPPKNPEFSANAETIEISETPSVDTSHKPLSTDALLSLVASLTQQMLSVQQQAAEDRRLAAEANQSLATAILKTTEPREILKSPQQLAQEANQRMFDDQAKEQTRRQKAVKKYTEDNCDHIAGGSPLSEQRDIAGRTSIVWHRNDAQVDIGVCTTCGGIFHPDDAPDAHGYTYGYWRKKPSFNKLSAAGVRQFMDPRQAMKDSYLRDS